MSTNQNKPLTSFLPASALAPQSPGTPLKPGEWDERLAAEVAAEILPGADKLGQNRTPHLPASAATSAKGAEISPGADKLGQNRTQPSVEDDNDDGDDSVEGSDSSPERFSRADELLVTEIATGASLREAAKRASVHERTVRRRWADPKFRQRVLNARCEIRWEAVGRLTAKMKKATETLEKGMDAKSESVRVSAARAILKIGSDMGGKQEENALLAEKLDQAVEFMGQNFGQIEN